VAESAARLGNVSGIPATAQDAWSELAGVLAVDGPAPCEEGDADAWWLSHADDADDVALAARCCAGCPARTECLAYALAANERGGIWGGLDTTERQPLGGRESA